MHVGVMVIAELVRQHVDGGVVNHMKDFFISYNKADKQWAEWIAWLLEDANYSVVIQAWDFRPGANFVLEMHKAAAGTERTISILSEDYLNAEYTHPEWAAAFAQDPRGQKRLLVPIRVRDCKPAGLLSQIIYVDLVGLSEQDARITILGAFSSRAKPAQTPSFPGSVQPTPPSVVQYPGPSKSSSVASIIVGTDGANIVPGASAESSRVSAEDKSVTYKGRLALHKKLNNMIVQHFNMLIFTLNPPPGVVPPMPASQGDRASSLLNWAESPGGCGLHQVEDILETILQS